MAGDMLPNCLGAVSKDALGVPTNWKCEGGGTSPNLKKSDPEKMKNYFLQCALDEQKNVICSSAKGGLIDLYNLICLDINN